jgi:hypothetical protein
VRGWLTRFGRSRHGRVLRLLADKRVFTAKAGASLEHPRSLPTCPTLGADLVQAKRLTTIPTSSWERHPPSDVSRVVGRTGQWSAAKQRYNQPLQPAVGDRPAKRPIRPPDPRVQRRRQPLSVDQDLTRLREPDCWAPGLLQGFVVPRAVAGGWLSR